LFRRIFAQDPRSPNIARTAAEFAGVPLKEAFGPLIDEFFVSQYRDVIAFNKEQKLIRNDVDFNAWAEPKYVNAALKELKLENFWARRNADGIVAKPSN